MNLYLIMKLLHVLAAFWMISGVVGRGLTFWQAGRATNIYAVHTLLQVSEFFERWAVIPISILVFLFGLILTWMQKWPILGFLQGSSSNWLLLSTILFFSIMGFIAPLGLVARRRQRTHALEEALAQGMITTELTTALNDKVVIRFRATEFITMLVIIVLMVTKPF